MAKPSVDEQIAALVTARDAEKKPLVAEAIAILADPEVKAKIARLAEIANELPGDAGRFRALRAPLRTLTNGFGHAVNVFEKALSDDEG
jgi:hypothetical protein